MPKEGAHDLHDAYYHLTYLSLIQLYHIYALCSHMPFRSDYIDWCLPLFGSDYGSTGDEFDNYNCSFLATNGNMYFVNHTSGMWEKEDCCLFAQVNYRHPPIYHYLSQRHGKILAWCIFA